VKITDVLDLAGGFCLIAFAYIIWPPAALALLGVGLLLISWNTSRRKRGRK
jgi:hypothetical protein